MMLSKKIDDVVDTVILLQRNTTEAAIFLRDHDGKDVEKYKKACGFIFILLAKHFLQEVEQSKLSPTTPFLLETEPSDFAKRMRASEECKLHPKQVLLYLIEHTINALKAASGKKLISPHTISSFSADLTEYVYDTDVDAFGSLLAYSSSN